MKKFLLALFCSMSLFGASQANAHLNVDVIIPTPGIYVAPTPVYTPPPVYVQPAPVYMEPRGEWNRYHGGRGWEHERREHEHREWERREHGEHRGW